MSAGHADIPASVESRLAVDLGAFLKSFQLADETSRHGVFLGNASNQIGISTPQPARALKRAYGLKP
jgi:hypothetical protein